jgi:NAD+ diphosphatase
MALKHLALSRSTLDRASHRRSDPELISTLWSDPQTRVIPVHDGQAPVQSVSASVSAGGSGLVLVEQSGAQWQELWAEALPGWVPDLAESAFLGEDAQGVAHVVIPVPQAGPLPDGARWAGLRETGTDLDDEGAGLLTAAVAVLAWHAAHGRCARCGTATAVAQAGWTRSCPNCGAEHYPRTDPAVIMSVVDDQDRILLGRQAVWPEHRYSTLAGFVEPGEPLEAAVRREVLEESGVRVGEVTYRGSQPWPFPSSLMLAFRGEALSTEITVDGVELGHAGWWSREQLAADIATGTLLLPPSLSIARHLIEDWYGGPVGGPEGWR